MFILDQQSSIASEYLRDLRNINVQKDRMRFRINLERLGFLLAYELSKSLDYADAPLKTPLGSFNGKTLSGKIALATILRAGLPLFNGFLEAFDQADAAFIGSFRTSDIPDKDGKMQVSLDYIAAGNLQDTQLILIDPMLATGASFIQAVHALGKYGEPVQVHLVSAIASKVGVDTVVSKLPKAKLWIGAVDPGLNENAYIVPGLGDAGDLSFGSKI